MFEPEVSWFGWRWNATGTCSNDCFLEGLIVGQTIKDSPLIAFVPQVAWSPLVVALRDGARKTQGQDGVAVLLCCWDLFIPYNVPVYPGAVRAADTQA